MDNGARRRGAAVAFVLFVIIGVFTLLQRVLLRERDTVPRRKRFRPSVPAPVDGSAR